MAHRWVVLAEHVKGFDTLEQAKAFSLLNVPSVICERRTGDDGRSEIVEVLRHDWLYDEVRHEWRYMLG